MKRIFYIVSVFAALSLAACQKEAQVDSVQLDPVSAEAEYLSGTAETTVTSSGAWTMEGDYTWVTPSAKSGNSGDKVTFTYGVNMGGKERAAIFKVRCGSAYTNFALRQESGVINLTAVLTETSSESGNYVLNLNVTSPKDIDKFVKWGVRWSTDAEKLITEGTDILIEGAPKEGDTAVTVKDFADGYTYYFVGWLELADGQRSYTEETVKIYITPTFDSAVEVKNVKAHQADFSFTVAFPVVETGVCLDEIDTDLTYGNAITYQFQYEGEGDIPAGTEVKINPLTTPMADDEEGFALYPQTKFYVRAFAKLANGEYVYGPTSNFTTIASPWDNLIVDGTFESDYNHFQSLCEFGPVKDGSWGDSQYVTEAASETQTNFRKWWNTALTSYSETSKYGALFSELAFVQNGSTTMMENIVWREGTAGENKPKDANRVGGFIYKVNDEGDGFFSFVPVSGYPYAFVPETSWAVANQGMKASEIVDVLGGASNVANLNAIRSFWSSGTFFLDWGEAKKFDGQDYTEILLYSDKGLHTDVFRFNAANFGQSKYDAEAQNGTTTWSLYVGEGTTDKTDLTELSTGGYYIRLDRSLAGKTVRISKSTGGYPAYIPTGDGKYKLVNSASDGTYTVPTANEWANKCAVSFSLGSNVCVVKDICVLTDTCFPSGDNIDGVDNWNASKSYNYFREKGFFAPTDKLTEPHIYRCNVKFKLNATGEGFKIPKTYNYTQGGYNSAVTSPNNNPLNTWIGVVVETSDGSTGTHDYKWKPDVAGDYVIELDVNAMQLRVVAK